MEDRNTQVFKNINQQILGIATNTFRRKTEQVRVELDKRVKQIADAAYTKMLTAYLPLVSGGYPAYSPGYQRLKDRSSQEGATRGFYELTGDLISQLEKRNPRRDFGNSVVTYSEKGTSLRGGFRLNSAGKPIVAATGRFAAGRDAFSSLRASLYVNLFPNLDGQVNGDIFNVFPDKERQVSIPREGGTPKKFLQAGLRTRLRVNEFGGPKGQSARPLLIPFLEFYSATVLNAEVQKKLKEL